VTNFMVYIVPGNPAAGGGMDVQMTLPLGMSRALRSGNAMLGRHVPHAKFYD
jgi:hypothetical protein